MIMWPVKSQKWLKLVYHPFKVYLAYGFRLTDREIYDAIEDNQTYRSSRWSTL